MKKASTPGLPARAIVWVLALSAFSPLAFAKNATYPPQEARPDSSYVTIDPASGLFRNAEGQFVTPSVTYVQANPKLGGTNAGPGQLLLMDFTRIRPDFRHMRELGVRAIYLHIGSVFFLNSKGDWRTFKDPFDGMRFAEEVKTETLARLAQAAKRGIGPFNYTYEVFDYLLDCARAEGIYVVAAILDGWESPRRYDLNEDNTDILYEDPWPNLETMKFPGSYSALRIPHCS